MNKVETICPYCKKANTVEKSSSRVDRHGLQNIRCAHCSKDWSANLSFAGTLEKSAGSTDLAALRVQVRAQFDELQKQINALQERRAAASRPARFQPQGEEAATVLKFVAGMPSGLMLEPNIADAAEASRQHSEFVTKTANGEAVAQAELEKALANGKPVTSANYTRADHGLEKEAPRRFRTAEEVAPGAQRFHSASDTDANFHERPGNTLGVTHAVEKAPGSAGERRSFQPDGQTDLGKATAECRDALTKGKPVGR